MPSWLLNQTAGANALAPMPTTAPLLPRPRPRRRVAEVAPPWLAAVAEAGDFQAAEEEEKPRGLWEQITDPVRNFVPGVAGFLSDALETAVVVPRLAYDVTLGSG